MIGLGFDGEFSRIAVNCSGDWRACSGDGVEVRSILIDGQGAVLGPGQEAADAIDAIGFECHHFPR
jgi:hypothetical protein